MGSLMSLMSLHMPSLHLPSPPLLLQVSVLEAIPGVPLLILTEALKVFVARGPLKKLPLLKMIKFTEPDTTAMLDKPSGDSPRLRGKLMLNLDTVTVIMDTPPTADTTDMDIMDTDFEESPDILLIPLTPSEVPKVLASKMQ